MFDADPDPWRIPPIMAALRDTWEAQPELSFAELLDVLHNHGLQWSTSDEDLAKLLEHLNADIPATVPRRAGKASGTFIVRTSEPDLQVTIDPTTVIMRLIGEPEARPTVWEYQKIERARVSELLAIRDGAGTIHHLGMVRSIRRCGTQTLPVRKDGCLYQEDLARREELWLLRFADSMVLVGGRKRLERWVIERRSTRYEQHPWHHIRGLRPTPPQASDASYSGVELFSRGTAQPLGTPQDILLVEAPLSRKRA